MSKTYYLRGINKLRTKFTAKQRDVKKYCKHTIEPILVTTRITVQYKFQNQFFSNFPEFLLNIH